MQEKKCKLADHKQAIIWWIYTIYFACMGLYCHLEELLSVQIEFYFIDGWNVRFMRLSISQHTTNMCVIVLEV